MNHFVQKDTFLSHYPNQKLVSNQQRDFGHSCMEEVMEVAMGAAMEEDTVEVMAKGLALGQPVLSRSIFVLKNCSYIGLEQYTFIKLEIKRFLQ